MTQVTTEEQKLTDTQVALVRAYLPRILKSDAFKASKNAVEFLTFVVGETLAGHGSKLTALYIGNAIIPEYDPSSNQVATRAATVRSRLLAYNVGSGSNDPVHITIPTNTYRPHFEFAADVPPPRPRPPRSSRPWWLIVTLVLLLAVAVSGGTWLWRQRSPASQAQPPAGSITTPRDGGFVSSAEDVEGTLAPPPAGHRVYLIIEPLDNSGQQWVHGEAEAPRWRIHALFGQSDTPDGMRFRISLLSTSAVLPRGLLTARPANAHQLVVTTVTLRK